MNLELIPIIVGGLVGLVGLALVFDAWVDDKVDIKSERRRGDRVDRSRKGEAAVGLGVLCMAAAFVGRDTWVYSVVSVIAGSVLLFGGMVANWSYLRATVGNRGPLRRRDQL